jgi:putative membrane protein
MTTAVEGNLAEVQMGQLAQQKGNSEGVRSYGQMLQQDHSAAAQSSTAVATQLGVTPPSEPNKKQKALSQSLSKLSGEAFDRKFVAEMIKDHKKEIAEYSKVARKQEQPRRCLRSADLAHPAEAPRNGAVTEQGCTASITRRTQARRRA